MKTNLKGYKKSEEIREKNLVSSSFGVEKCPPNHKILKNILQALEVEIHEKILSKRSIIAYESEKKNGK